MHVNQAFGDLWMYVCDELHLNRLWDKEITMQLPQVTHLHILEVG